jgi:hypothetical protein
VHCSEILHVPRTVASLTADAQEAAATVGRQVEVLTASTNGEIDAAFANMVKWPAEALLIGKPRD